MRRPDVCSLSLRESINPSYIFALLLALVYCASCNGEPKLIKNHFTNQYQEAADNIHCGLQDKAGNLWFGTTGDGVYRYDGRSFTNFTMKDGLDANQILSMVEDKAGNIWFGSRNGLCRFDGKTITKVPIAAIANNNFFPLNLSGQDPAAANAVWSMMQDKKGILWFGTDEGVYCFDGKIFKRFLDNPDISNRSGLTLKSVQSILEDSKGNIWFGSGPMAFEGICFYDGKTLSHYKPKNQQWIRKIEEGRNGIILFATRQAGVLYYDPAGQTGEKYFGSIPSPPAFSIGSLTYILEDKGGITWMASDYGNEPGDTLGGLWRSDLYTGKTTEKIFTKVTNEEVFFMLEDRDNNIWLGTRGTDLYRYDRKTFTKFSE